MSFNRKRDSVVERMHSFCDTFERMRTATLPPLRVEPELRARIESVLAEGESLSSLVELSVRQEVSRRIEIAGFHRRGFDALARADETGVKVPADAVLARLEQKLRDAKSRLVSR